MKRILLSILMLFTCFVTNVKAENNGAIIFAPHPDDEVLMTGGLIGQKTPLQKDDLKVVVITNGDYVLNKNQDGVAIGKTRIGETLNGLSALGFSSNIYFFGYGDQTLSKIASDSDPNKIFDSSAGRNTTYGSPEKGVTDYHSSIFGQPGNYNRTTILTDLKHILSTNKPIDIYVPCAYDANTDHWAAYRLIIEALIEIKKQNPSYCPNIFQYLIHAPGGNKVWPEGQGKNDFSKEFTVPSTNTVPPVPFSNLLQLKDELIVKYPVSIEMRSTKYDAIMKYQSQINKDSGNTKAYLTSFVKSNEFFWKNTLNNLAFNATVTVSSENEKYRQLGIKAIDGIIDGAKSDAVTDDLIREWATEGKTTAWIRLSWPQPQTMNRIVLYDRPNRDDCIQKATLTFSDGSTINVENLSDDGSGDMINFPEKNIVWVQLNIIQAKGNNTGLAEFEVYAAK